SWKGRPAAGAALLFCPGRPQERCRTEVVLTAPGGRARAAGCARPALIRRTGPPDRGVRHITLPGDARPAPLREHAACTCGKGSAACSPRMTGAPGGRAPASDFPLVARARLRTAARARQPSRSWLIGG